MAAILQSLIFALRTVFVSFNFYQLVSYTEQILLIKNDEAAGTSKQNKRKVLTLADKILVLDELKNKTLKQTMSMKKALSTQLL